jgi:ribonuclease HI
VAPGRKVADAKRAREEQRERLLALVEDDARTVSFVWVEGHGDEANNNIVDRLSREASKSHAEN